jgi:hypothetical protein
VWRRMMEVIVLSIHEFAFIENYNNKNIRMSVHVQDLEWVEMKTVYLLSLSFPYLSKEDNWEITGDVYP